MELHDNMQPLLRPAHIPRDCSLHAWSLFDFFFRKWKIHPVQHKKCENPKNSNKFMINSWIFIYENSKDPSVYRVQIKHWEISNTSILLEFYRYFLKKFGNSTSKVFLGNTTSQNKRGNFPE